MIIVDSCGWLEWFANGELADQYREHLTDTDNILLPTIILYEVYKILKRELSEEKALLAVGYMKKSKLIPFDDNLALIAADISLDGKLAMADAIIVATAQVQGCEIISSDADLKNQANVQYIKKNKK